MGVVGPILQLIGLAVIAVVAIGAAALVSPWLSALVIGVVLVGVGVALER